jgi:4-amino-4-deoxy-L-arabinose transferase-like glycosyltransferase
MAKSLDHAIPLVLDHGTLVVVEGRESSPRRLAGTVLTWERLALAGILLLSAFLDFFRLNQEGYANTYYAAAVKSMLSSWHNFFFVAFDPGGFLAVDKSPLGLWIQAGSAKLFGFSGTSLLLPQALAGVLSVVLLYHLVGRVFGPPAGLLAALSLALTPIAVVDNRNNTQDSLLILMLLLAAWAVTRAAESGRLRWLLLGAVLVGLGFNIKELQAYVVLPALLLVYLVGAPVRVRTRLWHLLLAGGALLIVSFSWIIAVDLTPASQRPYVSDSGTNSELSLALGYNGFGRLTAGILSHLPIPFLHVKLDFSIVPGISTEIGNPGLLRLLSPSIAEQASWLLPVALVGLGVAVWKSRPLAQAQLAQAQPAGFPMRREHLALVLWGTWLLTAAFFFSVARFYHLYYLIMLAPAVAALAGIGMVALWNDYRQSLRTRHDAYRLSRWNGWALPLTLLGTAGIQAHVLAAYAGASGWPAWLAPLVVATCILAAVALVAIRVGLRFLVTPDLLVPRNVRAALSLSVAGTLSLLVAPAAWSAVSVVDGNGGAWLPQAGPGQGFGGGFGLSRPAFGGQPGGGPPSASRRSFTPPANGFSRGNAPVGTMGGGPSGGGFGGAGGAITFAGSQVPTLDPHLLHYLEAHKGKARYLVATTTSTYASLFVLETGQPVMTLGGYQGWDRILTPAQLSRLASRGVIRFFLLPASGTGSSGGTRSSGGAKAGATGPSQFGGPGGNVNVPSVDAKLSNVNNDLLTWIRKHAKLVSASHYGSSSSSATSGLQLYEYTG